MFVDSIITEVDVLDLPEGIQQEYGIIELTGNLLPEEDSPIQLIDQLVYAFVKSCVDKESGSYHSTIDYISTALRCDKTVVEGSIKRLEEEEWLATKRGGDEIFFTFLFEKTDEPIYFNSQFLVHPKLDFKEKAYLLAIYQWLCPPNDVLQHDVKVLADEFKISLSELRKIEKSLKGKGIMEEKKYSEEDIDEDEGLTRDCSFKWDYINFTLPKDKEEAFIKRLESEKKEINKKELKRMEEFMKKNR